MPVAAPEVVLEASEGSSEAASEGPSEAAYETDTPEAAVAAAVEPYSSYSSGI